MAVQRIPQHIVIGVGLLLLFFASYSVAGYQKSYAASVRVETNREILKVKSVALREKQDLLLQQLEDLKKENTLLAKTDAGDSAAKREKAASLLAKLQTAEQHLEQFGRDAMEQHDALDQIVQDFDDCQLEDATVVTRFVDYMVEMVDVLKLSGGDVPEGLEDETWFTWETDWDDDDYRLR